MNDRLAVRMTLEKVVNRNIYTEVQLQLTALATSGSESPMPKNKIAKKGILSSYVHNPSKRALQNASRLFLKLSVTV